MYNYAVFVVKKERFHENEIFLYSFSNFKYDNIFQTYGKNSFYGILFVTKIPKEEGRKMKVMFICTGNICRSAMAHWLMKKKLEERKIKNIEVYSSGIFAMKGDIPPDEAIEVMEEYHVDLKQHRATPTIQSNIQEMDLILCMTNSHKQTLIGTYPNLVDKIFTLKEYTGLTEKGIDIKDPWGYTFAVYRFCAAEIDECLNKLIETILS